MASTRLPGKPLADIAGMPMIVRVWRQAVKAGIGPVLVAAAEREIADAIRSAGGEAVLTAPDLPSGSDRISRRCNRSIREAAHDVVVNLQGDLPALDPDAFEQVADTLAPTGADIATLAAEIDDPADFDNPSAIKAGGHLGRHRRAGPGALFHPGARALRRRPALRSHRHLRLPARRAAALRGLAPSPLETREKLEQLRALEAGMSIAVARVDEVPLSVDTPEPISKGRAPSSQGTGTTMTDTADFPRQEGRLPGRARRLCQSGRARGAAACMAIPKPTFERCRGGGARGRNRSGHHPGREFAAWAASPTSIICCPMPASTSWASTSCASSINCWA